MQKLTILISATAFSMFLITSCGKKYPDGGKIKKATDNIEGTWSLNAYFVDGVDQTSTLIISGMKEIYTEGSVDGEGTLTRSYTDPEGDAKTQNGNYKFDAEYTEVDVDGVGSIEFTEDRGTQSSSTYNVLMLKSDEYRYSYSNGGNTHEFRFIKN